MEVMFHPLQDLGFDSSVLERSYKELQRWVSQVAVDLEQLSSQLWVENVVCSWFRQLQGS